MDTKIHCSIPNLPWVIKNISKNIRILRFVHMFMPESFLAKIN